MITLIILLVLLGIVLWLLLAPITVNVNTWNNDFSINWTGIARASLGLKERELLIRLRVFFWRRDFFPLRASPKKPGRKKPKPKKGGRSRWRPFSMKRARKLMEAVHVRQFRFELDTGDYVSNAYLYPMAYFLSSPTRQLSVNFADRTNVQLQIEIRLIRVLRALIF